MNDPRTVLEAIHVNAEMGRETIFHLRRKAQGSFAGMLRTQQAGYDSILARSGEMLRAMGAAPKRPAWMLRMMADMGMDLRTLRDSSTPKLAQLLIRGASMGVTDMKKALRLHPGAQQEVLALGEELIQMEQQQMRQWVEKL